MFIELKSQLEKAKWKNKKADLKNKFKEYGSNGRMGNLRY
jgi:hypothetical protein